MSRLLRKVFPRYRIHWKCLNERSAGEDDSIPDLPIGVKSSVVLPLIICSIAHRERWILAPHPPDDVPRWTIDIENSPAVPRIDEIISIVVLVNGVDMLQSKVDKQISNWEISSEPYKEIVRLSQGTGISKRLVALGNIDVIYSGPCKDCFVC